MKTFFKKYPYFIILIALVAGALIWLTTTNHPAIWPIRNTLQYRLYTWLNIPIDSPAKVKSGSLQGTVSEPQGQPIEGAWVLLARRNGTTYSDRSDAEGQYIIEDIPPGSYRPVASAPGYQNVQFGGVFDQMQIRANEQTTTNVTLPPKPEQTVSPGQNFKLGQATTRTCNRPLKAKATRRQIHFTSAGQPNQLAFYYTPVTATTTSQLPILLAVYPGPAESWECASLPLTAAGYIVIATGPAYSFDLEADVDELARILNFTREGQFPGSDEDRIALLGGSYSTLHVLRLLQRGQPVQAALLLGPPTDLFDMRRRLEEGTYVPPFGLDQALIALGFPDQQPLRYFRYSGAYHVRSDFPPLAILHSRTDEVVPYEQSELLVKNLERRGVPYEVHFFDGASHYLLAEDSDEDTLMIYEITLEFLAEHLK